MAQLIGFRDYLEYADRHVQMATDELVLSHDAKWLLIPAAILAWSSIESFINSMLDDFNALPDSIFQLHEKALLTEKKIRFVDNGSNIGQFTLEGKEYRKLEDKIFFLLAKCGSGETGIKGDQLWQKFQNFKTARDTLIHPRRTQEVELSVSIVEQYIATAKQIIQLLSKHVWDKEIKF